MEEEEILICELYLDELIECVYSSYLRTAQYKGE